MDYVHARKILRDNLLAADGTFIGALHEDCRFDQESYERFCDAAGEVVGRLKNDADVDVYTSAMLFAVYALVQKYFLWDVDPGDGYSIDEFDDQHKAHVYEELDGIFDDRWLIDHVKLP